MIIFFSHLPVTDYVLPSWPFGDVWCKVVQYLIVVTAYVSVYTLVLMSFDRFLAVVHPIASMSVRTEANTYLAIGVTWLVILAVCVPLLPAHGEFKYDFEEREHSTCMFLHMDGYSQSAFQITFFATSYAVPLLLICGLYLRMLMRLWRGAPPGGRISAESRRGKKRVTRMIIVVVVIFAVCWAPIQTVLVLKSVNLYHITPLTIVIQVTAHVLAYMNSCVNPFLYAYLSENFRKAFRKVVYCRALSGVHHVFNHAANNGDLHPARARSQRQHNNGDAGKPSATRTIHLHKTTTATVVNGLEDDQEAVDVL